MSDHSKHTLNFSAKRRALLEVLRQEEGLEASSLQQIPRRKDNDAAPASFAQQRLWLLDQLAPGSPFHNIPLALRLTGQLNVAALERCLNEMKRRHETLRTTFAMVEGNLMEMIASTLNVPLRVENLEALPQTERELMALQLISQEARHPFDLVRGPLMNACLLRLSETEHVLLLTMHHIISDGWSMGVLMRELSVIYEAYAVGNTSPLPELPIQYADFAAWQRERLQGEMLDTQLSYWKQRLEGVPAVLELPLDRPRPSMQTFDGALYSFTLSRRVSEELKALSQREGVTLFMTLLAAFQVLLHRYSGQKDIVLGSPIAGRKHAQLEDLIGFFINMLVMRTDLSGNPTFNDVLRRVREVALGAYAHQDVPFEKLVEELQPERDLSHMPFIQATFQLHNAPGHALNLPGLTLQQMNVASGMVPFDLMLGLIETPDGLQGNIEYNTNLFDADTIVRMAGHFRTLLEGIVAQPERHIADYPLLTQAERHQLLVDWNDTKTSYEGRCIHELFEEQVKRTPEAVAVVFEGQQLTYHELNQQANQLAHHLKQTGVGPGSLVVVCMERTLEIVPALLGILKAGGAYVPLEPSFPMARIHWILESLRSSCLLTQTSQIPLLRTLEPLPSLRHIICLDKIPSAEADVQVEYATLQSARVWTRAEVDALPRENLPPQAGLDDLAYIIFTSGSTGKPKGVVETHRPVCNLIDWVNRTCRVNKTDRVLLVASLCFDLSVYDIFGLLAAGGSIQVVSNRDLRDPARLLRFLAEEPVTFWDSAPAALQQLVPFFLEVTSSDQNNKQSALRLVFLSGDWIPVKLPDQMRAVFPGARIIGLGGATEATVWSNYYPIGLVEPGQVSIPYGKPIQNARYYVLDANYAPCPVGIAGDLYIGGECLSMGYAQEPILTAEKFVPDPFSTEPGMRLYRTGDLARFMRDGNIEFLGRNDHQVKIRGFRIELGEIESVLNKHPDVRVSIVVAQGETRSNRRLVAYVVPHQSQKVNLTSTVQELRRYLQEQLPDYMIPSTTVLLDELPVTANGKVDRAALPIPDAVHPTDEETFAPPRSPMEELMLSIWTDVLEVERIGIHDNFFELGGHSLLATQVIARVRTIFHVEVPLRTLFEGPTVADLANYVEAILRTKQGIHVPPIEARSQVGNSPLSFAQERLWFLDKLAPGSPFYNIPLALRLRGQVNITVLQQSFNEIGRRHEVLRTTFATVNGNPAQVIAPTLNVLLPVIDLEAMKGTQEQDVELRRLVSEEAQRSFDLSRGPLLRVHVVKLNKAEHILLLTMHHIAADAWSMSVLVQELTTLYTSFSTGQPSLLPELPIQYADFAVWQRQWLRDEVLEQQLAYWRKQLADLPPVLKLPTDRSHPAMQTFRGAQQFFVFHRHLYESLKLLSRREEVTLFITLLAAFKVLLFRYTGEEDIVIGTPIAGRTQVETERLIGFFVNTLVLRTNLAENPSFCELLGRVREVALDAYAHQDLPFEQLVEALRPERDLSHSPFFQVAFALQNVPLSELHLGDLELEALVIESETAKYTLTLSLSEAGGDLLGAIEYNTDLFDHTTITRMLNHLLVLLEGITANPEQRLSELPILTEAERRQILLEWNNTQAPFSEGKNIHQRFEEQVEQRPHTVAAIFEQEQLTCGELNIRANQLAHYLQKMGMGPSTLVGICIESSLEMVVAILGVLKAGGVYVPFDPTYPAERLKYMLEDSNVPLLLTQQRLQTQLPEYRGRMILLDTDWSDIAHMSTTNLPGDSYLEMPAYMIYTSGSTGRPKGVLVAHRGVCNLIDWQRSTFGVQQDSRVLQFSSFGFDASVFEIFKALLTGSALCLAPRDALLPGSDLLQLFADQAITIVTLPPSVLAVLPFRELPALETIIVAGEACSIDTLTPWRRGRRIFNAYGPTEATVCASAVMLVPGSNTITIGRPITNTQLYIVDSALHPVPAGVPGELLIGGIGLAQGYFHRPELTAERFIPHPFSTEPGVRLYRTGDMARFLPDGTIEFLGRNDQQVKLRGFRIEPGEIEMVLKQHPAVNDAAVVVREDPSGEMRLVSYIVSKQLVAPDNDVELWPSVAEYFVYDDVLYNGTPQLAVSELRHYLQKRLPDYMVPSSFVMIDALPLTSNGKVNRSALPNPSQLRSSVGAAYIAPRTVLEETIAKLWQEVLHVEKVGVHDNFFDLGGHSLLLVGVQNRLYEVLNRNLAIVEMFKHPTIGSLSEYLSREPGAPSVTEQIDDRIEKLGEGKSRSRQRLEQKLRAAKNSKELR